MNEEFPGPGLLRGISVWEQNSFIPRGKEIGTNIGLLGVLYVECFNEEHSPDRELMRLYRRSVYFRVERGPKLGERE